MANVKMILHTHNQWSFMIKINQFVASVKKVYIINISEHSWENSCKLKTFSYDLAHSQSVTMHEKITQEQIKL